MDTFNFTEQASLFVDFDFMDKMLKPYKAVGINVLWTDAWGEKVFSKSTCCDARFFVAYWEAMTIEANRTAKVYYIKTC